MIDLWTTQGDHVISGCDWVDYMHHWDTLLLAHFSIRIPTYTPAPVREERDNRLIKILHAPNHRTIKGTYFIVKAIQALKDEGFPFELVLAERVPNSEVQRLIKESDIIIDQLIVGWYAMFAIEAMAQGKPVICYLRNDLIELFKANSLIETSEDIPIINTTINSLKTVLIEIYLNPKTLNERGVASYDFVKKFHSIEAISSVFKPILNKLMIN
jgi:glycosyltransferase involved in cell wall biosynthesis